MVMLIHKETDGSDDVHINFIDVGILHLFIYISIISILYIYIYIYIF